MNRAIESPVTDAQRAIWTLQRIEPSLHALSGGYAVSVDEPLDRALLAEALRGMVLRHESLRTTFRAGDGRPVARIHEEMDIPIEWYAAEHDCDAGLIERMIDDIRRPYDLERGPLERFSVYVRGTGEHVVLAGVHHLNSDLLSLRLSLEELEARYTALRDGVPDGLPPLSRQFREHAAWQSAMLESDEGRRHHEYWREHLAGDAPDLDMPLDRPRPPVESHQAASHLFEVPAALVSELDAGARAVGATLYSALVAGYAVLFHRYSGASPITIGSYTSGRVRRDLDPMLGLVSNPIPLRIAVDGQAPFWQLVQRVGRLVRGALRHQFYPLALMAERIERPRDPGRSPLFQAAFNLARDVPMRHPGPRWRHDAWIPLQLRNQEGQFEFRLLTYLRRDGVLQGSLQYQTALYERATGARLAASWARLLEDAVREPSRAVDSLRLLDPADERLVTLDWNDTAREYPREAGVHALVLEQCDRTPEATAVCHGADSVTYAGLAARVDGLATRLRAMGVGPGHVVGLCLPPSIDQVAALLAVLATPAAYLPLDPASPCDRRRAMLADAGGSTVIGRADTVEGLGARQELLVDAPPGPAPGGAPAVDRAGGEQLAYVLFTSGSTGRPKGVEITHRSLVNLLFAMRDLLGVTPADTWLSVTTLSFDIAALEILLPLACGARLVMADREVAGSGARLADEIERHGATVVQATPTSWRLLHAAAGPLRRPVTRLCGGEALTRALADQLLEGPGPAWNVYGPTETTIWSTAGRITAGHRTPSIGRPIGNTQVYVLDPRMRPVPIGVTGELWIGGDGVARGYVGRPELTAERFVADPFSHRPGARLYRTGDLARWLPSGEIEFLGRDDQQVKIRGIRIELGEIEAALLAQPGVAEAAVVARAGARGELQLAAYVVAAAGADPDGAVLRRELRLRLPDYMIPATFTRLDAMPLTPNRKVDRKALPDPGLGARPESAFAGPRTPVESLLAKLVSEVLKVERVGIDDDFFELGGASLASLELEVRAEEEGLRLTAESVFEFRTVRALAARIAREDGVGAGAGGAS